MVNEDLIKLAMPYSKGGLMRLRATWIACADVDKQNVPGAFVECGVWRGGMVMVARWAAPSRQCWLYDTFAGMTEPGPNDTKRGGKIIDAKHWTGKSAISLQEVEQNLMNVGVHDLARVQLVMGDVRETLLKDYLLPTQIAVLRLDTDFYDSTKIEMEKLYPRLVSGGYLIVDDYGHWSGAKKAVDDYLGKTSQRLRAIDYTCAWMQKP